MSWKCPHCYEYVTVGEGHRCGMEKYPPLGPGRTEAPNLHKKLQRGAISSRPCFTCGVDILEHDKLKKAVRVLTDGLARISDSGSSSWDEAQYVLDAVKELKLRGM